MPKMLNESYLTRIRTKVFAEMDRNQIVFNCLFWEMLF